MRTNVKITDQDLRNQLAKSILLQKAKVRKRTWRDVKKKPLEIGVFFIYMLFAFNWFICAIRYHFSMIVDIFRFILFIARKFRLAI